jgi:tyrosyl-tRNA synthetase
MQCGGNDQWGNLTAGVDLIRKVTGESVHALTTPIIAKSDGSKFGKSEGGAIWLDPEMMSPFSFYQFWLNVEDADVVNLLKVFTFLDRSTIESLAEVVRTYPGDREAQQVLAKEVTNFVHGEDALNQAITASSVLFGKAEVSGLKSETLAQIAKEVNSVKTVVGQDLGELFVDSGLCSSLSDYRRTVQSKGLSLNNVVLDSDQAKVRAEDLLAGKYLLLKRGKKNYAVGEV